MNTDRYWCSYSRSISRLLQLILSIESIAIDVMPLYSGCLFEKLIGFQKKVEFCPRNAFSWREVQRSSRLSSKNALNYPGFAKTLRNPAWPIDRSILRSAQLEHWTTSSPSWTRLNSVDEHLSSFQPLCTNYCNTQTVEPFFDCENSSPAFSSQKQRWGRLYGSRNFDRSEQLNGQPAWSYADIQLVSS